MRSAQIVSAAVTAVGLAQAWHLQVHNQVAFAAEEFLRDSTKLMVSEILEPQYEGSIGRAAAWADTVRKVGHPYSYTWHFISAKDNPPENCSLSYERDCQEGGCVVQQIANQTEILEDCVSRLRRGVYKPDIDCQQALKWVIHFVGDVAQPLHTSERSYGGNTEKVVFNGTASNLHETWDRWILYTGTNKPDGFGDEKIDPYFHGLANRIRVDAFKQPRKEWNMCDVANNNGTICPEQWAKDSNALVCSYVYGKLSTPRKDLFTSGYAEGAFPLVEFQLAKAAWRMASWLNAVADRGLGADWIRDAGEREGLEL